MHAAIHRLSSICAVLLLSTAPSILEAQSQGQNQGGSSPDASGQIEAIDEARTEAQGQSERQGLRSTREAGCEDMPGHSELRDVLRQSVQPAGGPSNGGLDLHMWATVVNRAGEVCAVVFSGNGPGDQWPGSRVISAQKANTANAFSLPGLALSTANLPAPVQPGGSLFGLQHSNPVDTEVAYRGRFSTFGSQHDPMVGERIGGINVFGGGLALYTEAGEIVGGLGVSGDTSCADHNVAWRVRDALRLAHVPTGVGPNGDDGIIYGGDSAFPHPACGGSERTVAQGIGAGG